jgi:hypothetical protein
MLRSSIHKIRFRVLGQGTDYSHYVNWSYFHSLAKVRDRDWKCLDCHTGAWRREGKCSLFLNFGTLWAKCEHMHWLTSTWLGGRVRPRNQAGWTQYHHPPFQNTISKQYPAQTLKANKLVQWLTWYTGTESVLKLKLHWCGVLTWNKRQELVQNAQLHSFL